MILHRQYVDRHFQSSSPVSASPCPAGHVPSSLAAPCLSISYNCPPTSAKPSGKIMTHVYLYPSDKFCGEFSLVRKFASPPAAIIGVHSSVGRAAARRDGYNGDNVVLGKCCSLNFTIFSQSIEPPTLHTSCI